jgi:ferredoxin
MATFQNRFPKNIPGKYYIDDQCTDCDLCRETAPNNIRRDDEMGMSYVYRQPTTPDEIAACEEGVGGCPTEAVGNDGDKYDWRTTPIRDWTTYSESLRPYLAGLPIAREGGSFFLALLRRFVR